MSIKEQAKQVATVKRAENGMIYDPVTITPRGRKTKDMMQGDFTMHCDKCNPLVL